VRPLRKSPEFPPACPVVDYVRRYQDAPALQPATNPHDNVGYVPGSVVKKQIVNLGLEAVDAFCRYAVDLIGGNSDWRQ